MNVSQQRILKQVRGMPSKDNESPLTSAGYGHHASSKGRTLYIRGNNNYGQLGNGTRENSEVPISIKFSSDITGIACGQSFTVVITKDGKTWSCGQHCKTILDPHHGSINSSVKEGTGDSLIFLEVKKIASRRAIKVFASTWDYIVVFDDGSVFIKRHECREGFMFSLDQKIVDVAIGDNVYLVTENGLLFEISICSGKLMGEDVETLNIEDITTTRQIKLPENVVKISAGSTFLTILLGSGKVYTHCVPYVWTTDDGKEYPGVSVGYTDKYGPGGAFRAKRNPPKLVDLVDQISSISSNYNTASALSKDGKLYIWCPEIKLKHCEKKNCTNKPMSNGIYCQPCWTTCCDYCERKHLGHWGECGWLNSGKYSDEVQPKPSEDKIEISPISYIPNGCKITSSYVGYDFMILILDNNTVYYWGNKRFPKWKI